MQTSRICDSPFYLHSDGWALHSSPLRQVSHFILVLLFGLVKGKAYRKTFCWVKGLQLETGCPVEDYFKLWVVETNRVNPCAHVVANLVSKTRPQNRQKLENIFGKIDIFLAQNPIFHAQNSIFFNGFLISEKSEKIFFNNFPISLTAFRFLWCISTFRNGFLIFLNGFPISSTAFRFSSTAFHFPRNPGKSIYGGKYTKDRYPSFIFHPKLRYSAIKIIGGKNTKDHYPSFIFSC
jgi:hypothetical protein